jgi:hypothetical protein
MKALTDTGKELFIPADCSEIKFSQYIEMSKREQKFFECNKAAGDDVLERADINVEYVMECVSAICGDVGDMVYNDGADVEQMVNRGYNALLPSNMGQELTVARLYAHIVTLISSYEPKQLPLDMVFEWGGSTYTINKDEAARSLLNIPLTAGEVVVTLELQKKTAKMVQKKGDVDGNFAFNLGIQEFAVLVRKLGERLPSNRRERISFIDKRSRLFATLPMDIVLDVRFFLLRTLKDYIKTRLTSFSSTLQKGLGKQNRKETQSKKQGKNRKPSGK